MWRRKIEIWIWILNGIVFAVNAWLVYEIIKYCLYN
jgi:hypothetical protein